MAEIQAPNGYEVNEAIDGANDIMEVFQPGSAGTRRNKKALLDTLAIFFQALAAGVAGRIVTLTAGGAMQDSAVNISDVNDNTTHRGSDGSNHFNVANSLKGMNRVVLTNYTTTGIPAIAANSQCEINGPIYTNPSEVVISGSTANTTFYDILLTPSGTTFTASFIARDTGIWSDSKQGLYSGNNRVVAIAKRDTSSSVWINKNILIINNRSIKIKMEIGDWDMDTTPDLVLDHGLSNHAKILCLEGLIRNDADSTRYAFFSNTGGNMIQVVGSTIRPSRVAGGLFDAAIFSSTSYNRGWLIITYEG